MLETVMTPQRFSVPVGDGEIAGWRWPNESAPPFLFCHATGFCASAYKQMLPHVAERFDVFAIDMRGHGRTTLPADPSSLKDWSVYVQDVRRFLDLKDRNGWTLAGHSMGAAVAVMTARGRDDVAAIRLVEPVAMPPFVRILARAPFWRSWATSHPPANLAKNRRADWPDRETMLATYEKKRLFRRFAPGALADYLEDGVVDTPEGVMLACNPAWETATFAAQANDFWGAVRVAPAPLAVLAAKDKSSTVFAGAEGRFRRAGAEFQTMNDASHLIPMERPEEAAAFLSDRRQAARRRE